MLDSCRALETEGFDVTYLPVGKNGIIDLNVSHTLPPTLAPPPLQELESAVRPDTSLVSIMTVNNEIGVRQPVEEIG